MLQDELTLEPNEKLPKLEIFDANVDIFFVIFLLPQEGQLISLAWFELRTSSSNGSLHSLQVNSKIGIFCS